jgi:CRP/FNR family cyclic AMP-dependent transcriptional regulator
MNVSNQPKSEQLNAHDLANDIAEIPFFAGMNDRHIRVLAGAACRTRFGEDQVIFHQGETANRFYLIEEGVIELEATLEPGERRIVAGTIHPGDVLGWSWLFPPFEWQFTARALNQTTAIFFYGTVLREHCETDPSLGFELFKLMAQEMVKRLQSARQLLLKAGVTGFSPVGVEHPIYGAQPGQNEELYVTQHSTTLRREIAGQRR